VVLLILFKNKLLIVVHILPLTTTTNAKCSQTGSTRYAEIHENEQLFPRNRLCVLNVCTSTTSPGTTLGINTTLPSGPLLPKRLCTSIKDFYLMKDNFVCIFLAMAQK
jgi:hypothetical protein